MIAAILVSTCVIILAIILATAYIVIDNKTKKDEPLSVDIEAIGLNYLWEYSQSKKQERDSKVSRQLRTLDDKDE